MPVAVIMKMNTVIIGMFTVLTSVQHAMAPALILLQVDNVKTVTGQAK